MTEDASDHGQSYIYIPNRYTTLYTSEMKKILQMFRDGTDIKTIYSNKDGVIFTTHTFLSAILYP